MRNNNDFSLKEVEIFEPPNNSSSTEDLIENSIIEIFKSDFHGTNDIVDDDYLLEK